MIFSLKLFVVTESYKRRTDSPTTVTKLKTFATIHVSMCMHDLGPIRHLLLITYLITVPHLLPAKRNRTSIIFSLLNECHEDPQHGPPTSPDLHIREFYLRGNRTDMVHQQNVETRYALLPLQITYKTILKEWRELQAQFTHLIGDPENQRPDKWNSTVQRPGRKADHSAPTSADVNDGRSPAPYTVRVCTGTTLSSRVNASTLH